MTGEIKMKKRVFTLCLSIAVVFLFGGGAQAALIDFSGLTDYQSISDDYGDDLLPNVDVEYNVATRAGVNLSDPPSTDLRMYPSGYGDLENAATRLGSVPGLVVDQITITPDSGYTVSLLSFDIASWTPMYPNGRNEWIRIIDETGTVLWGSESWGEADRLFVTADGHTTFTPNVTHDGLIRLQFNYQNYYTAVDNLEIDQSPVPVPAAVWLLGSGPVGLLRLRRRTRL
jgi:hypothetical protein